MSETIGDQWWLQEPPDTELEPADPYMIEPDDFDDQRVLLNVKGERISANEEHDLFAGASLVEFEDELRLHVPPRIVQSDTNGDWILRVEGKRRWFKEHDDYGTIRFTGDGIGLWIVNQYPLEEVDAYGMPIFLDRERIDIEVTLQQAFRDRSNAYPETRITTPYGMFEARNNIEVSYGTDRYYYTDFSRQGHESTIWEVKFPVPWRSKRQTDKEFVAELRQNGEYERAEYFINSGHDVELALRSKPFGYESRTVFPTVGSEPGVMFVPVDVIRSGNIDAKISFTNL